MTEDGINQLISALFSREDAQVFESYSAYGEKPIQFSSTSELSQYLSENLSTPKGHVDISVIYPDMGGTVEIEKIELNPRKCNGHTERYKCSGWGLITVQINNQSNSLTRVTANSEKRAIQWANTYPELLAPNTWEWPAVARHVRRLQRVLKRVT